MSVGAREPGRMAQVWLPGAVLALAVMAVYAQSAGFGFSSYDDTIYVSENPVITAGITWAGVREVVVHGHHLLWTPITSLSYMIGCAIHGTNAAGHHLTSVGLHIVAAWLVFLVIWRYTRALWFAWFVAAVFALHPLNAESVAWVSGRKNQLYAVFWMLSLLAYLRYTKTLTLRSYLPLVLLHLCGLASKPTHIMLPAVLILLDFCPLNRVVRAPVLSWNWIKCVLTLVAEKLPLFALSLAITVWTVGTVDEAGGMRDLAAVPLGERLGNTAFVYAWFVAKTFWPMDLTIHYPYPVGGFETATLAASVALIGVLTAVSVVSFFRGRVFFLGWWWFLIVLLPESGLLRANSFLMADRYAYVSVIGLVIAFGWPIYRWAQARPAWRRGVAFAGAAVLVAMIPVTALQAATWKDDEALFSRAARLYPQNPVAHNSLGVALKKAGRLDEAELAFKSALACPGLFKVLPGMNLGALYFERGDMKAASERFEEIAARSPEYVPALVWAARTRAALGQTDGAAAVLDRAALIAPGNPEVIAALAGRAPDSLRGLADLAGAYLALDRPREARAVTWKTESPDGALLKIRWVAEMQLGEAAAAETTIRTYLARHEDEAKGWAALSVTLEALQRLDEARAAAEKALAIEPGYPQAEELLRRLSPK